MNRLSWIFVGTTSVIIILALGFYFFPSAKSSWQTYRKYKDAKKELLDTSKKIEILNNLSQGDRLTTVYNIASGYIPQDQASGDLVIELTAIAAQSNLKVNQFSLDTAKTSSSSSSSSNSPDSSDTSKSSTSTSSDSSSSTTQKADSNLTGATEMKFSITLTGGFSDFQGFLKGVETGSRLISFTTIALSGDKDSFKAQLSGKAYWKKAAKIDPTLANVDIPEKTINKFLGLKTYGNKIDLPTESGFGREDPFAGY